MKPKRIHGECGNGRMPASAPLANPYVPFQSEDPPVYEPRRGIVRGTMYPGLDLPFQGKGNTKELNAAPLTQLQSLAFAVQDLALYLDTHRNDREALAQYRACQQMYRSCLEQYEAVHGPMNHGTPDAEGEYRWLDDPWPWEYCKNKGAY